VTRPVMAAIRVRQSRRWLTYVKAYRRYSPTQASRIAVDNSEDEIRRAFFLKKFLSKSAASIYDRPCKAHGHRLCIAAC
jgi:hypothetical protein